MNVIGKIEGKWSAKLLLLSMAIGVLCGVGATVLKWLVRHIGLLFVPHLSADHGNFRFLIYPLAGVLLTSIWQRYVVRNDCSLSTMRIRQALTTDGHRISGKVIWNSIISCAMTIGFGATAGTEGPIAYSGAAIGSNLGRWLRLPDDKVRLLIGVGAGAGIAAIFKSPIGGALFTIEILNLEMGILGVLHLIIACAVATATAQVLSHYTFDIPVGELQPFDVGTLGWVALFGVFVGFYCLYYNYTKDMMRKLLTAIDSPWAKAIISGVILSLTLFLMPIFFGEGDPAINSLVAGKIPDMISYGPFPQLTESGSALFICLGVVLLLKGALVGAAYYGGGVAGDFMPTLFAGCFAGGIFALGCNALFGAHLEIYYFALMGMGAVMGGTLSAPLMGIFVATECTGTYRYLPAYIVAVIVCYIIVRIFGPKAGSDAAADSENNTVTDAVKDTGKEDARVNISENKR